MDAATPLLDRALHDSRLMTCFQDLPDPRARNAIHKLHDMLVIAICAVICGAQGWAEVEVFGNSKLQFFRQFLDLPNGIASHDTFGRVFAALDPQAFEECFQAWTANLARRPDGPAVNIDAKALRQSFQHAWDKSGMAKLVSAFVSASRMVFGQLAVENGDEIGAIKQLLAMLDIRGAVVSIDAVGTQQEICRQIKRQEADYVLPVKDNQPTLHQQVSGLLNEALLEKFDGLGHSCFEETCGGHGRIETRRVWISDELAGHLKMPWPGLQSIAVVERTRQILGTDIVQRERQCYISSLKGCDAERFAGLVRGHWSIENQLHWQLDVSFREDERRVRKGHGAENFSRLCRMALNLLKQDTNAKVGMHGRRLKAGWDEQYLIKILMQ